MLSKYERHVMRQAVRQTWEICALELASFHPSERRTVRAEMRKRGFRRDWERDTFSRPFTTTFRTVPRLRRS